MFRFYNKVDFFIRRQNRLKYKADMLMKVFLAQAGAIFCGFKYSLR